MVNVTPATAPTFPILYTWGGQVYEIASLSGLGCADTVYSTTAVTNNGTTTYNPYVVLPANQALQIIEAYEAQFGVPNMACSSLIQQAELLSGASSSASASTTVLGYNLATVGGIVDFGIFLVVLFVIIAVIAWSARKAMDELFGRRR